MIYSTWQGKIHKICIQSKITSCVKEQEKNTLYNEENCQSKLTQS